VVGRRIADAMGSLVRIARALERGEAAAPLRTGVTEVNTVAEQLRGAAELVRQREYEAARREKEARAIGEVAHALNASPDLDAILRTALGAARRLVEAASSRIALVDEAGRLVLRYSSVVSTAMAPGFVIERGRGLGGLALGTRAARPQRGHRRGPPLPRRPVSAPRAGGRHHGLHRGTDHERGRRGGGDVREPRDP
jgi:hypothetical protein